MNQAEPIIDVYFVVLENTLLLDLAGPAESLRIANRVLNKQGKQNRFTISYVGVDSRALLSTGLAVTNLTPLPNPTVLSQATINKTSWVVVLGQTSTHHIDTSAPHNKQVIDWLSQLTIQKEVLEVITICAGSVLLGLSGHLDNTKATTHHQELEQLMQVAPRCLVQQDCIFTEDGAIASSAGVTTGIDLMVHKIAGVCGEIVASEVAQWLVMPNRRSATDKQYSRLLHHRNHLHPLVHRVQEAINLAPKTDWTLNTLAILAHTSPRNLTRLFKKHTTVTPMNYVNQVRIELAKSALKAGFTVSSAAEAAGFHSDVQLRRAWKKFEQGIPSDYIT